MSIRKLTQEEIKRLDNSGCSAESWNSILVAGGFKPERIRNTRFSGNITLGKFEKPVSFPGGVEKPSGIYNCVLHNTNVGDNVYVSEVGCIANYTLSEDVVIERVGSLTVDGRNSFGNGIKLNVLNEAGGRTLIIYDRLTVQIAYFLVLYRYNPALIKNLEGLIEDYVKTRISDSGSLGRSCRVTNCTRLENLEVGPYAVISGASCLKHGTICSCKEDPAFVGEGVTAEHFIFLSGSSVDNAAIIESCFIGQGVQIGRQFSAEHSAFFANCEGFHGEVCSVFAGPYTVTHHKATLLIAGLLSFYNAGSGTNQSNHMYKLGPVHQGILERGSKTGSSSYLLWPCRVGPFTTVTGKHYSNFDTSIFPFSNISEKYGKSLLTPAVNLLNVGSIRDSRKWPARDRRKDPQKLDLIHFKLFNPFIIGRMVKGRETLLALKDETPNNRDIVNHEGVIIRRLMLKVCARYYDMGINIFIGDCLVSKLEKLMPETNLEQLKTALFSERSERSERWGFSEWLDIGGMFAPSEEIKKLSGELAGGRIKNLDELSFRFKQIYDRYDEEEWAYCLNLMETRSGVKFENMTPEYLSGIIRDWIQNSIKLNNMILKDAEKEFDDRSRIGFGMDGGKHEKEEDFKAVRGRAEENSFIKQIKAESRAIEERAAKILALLENKL